jgi:hypothetical protein
MSDVSPLSRLIRTYIEELIDSLVDGGNLGGPLEEAMIKAGVLDTPTIYFLESID